MIRRAQPTGTCSGRWVYHDGQTGRAGHLYGYPVTAAPGIRAGIEAARGEARDKLIPDARRAPERTA